MSWIDSLMFTPDQDPTLAGRIKTADLQAAGGPGAPQTPADVLLRQQTARNIASQYALAATLRARTAAGASQQASTGVADANAQSTEQGVALQSQEQIQAQQRADALHAYQTQLSQAQANARNKLLGGLVNVIAPSIMGLGPSGGFSGADTSAAPPAAAAAPAAGAGAGTDAATGYASGAAGSAAAGDAGLGLGSLAGAGTDAEALDLVSDRRAKKAIRTGNPALDRLGAALQPKEFEYRNPADGPGERVGVLAQDAEKGGPLGQAMVKDGPGGELHLDAANAVGAALAGFAQLSKRVKALEARR